MQPPLSIKKVGVTLGRVICGVAIALALIFCWFAVRWQLGDMLATLTPSNSPNAKEIAEIAAGLAPNAPAPYWLISVKQRQDFSPESIDASVASLERSVRLSPFDFRWWVELGRAYEQSEQPEKAEAAFQKAIELAPEYTFPRWQIGNFYLRDGREDLAFEQLRKATEKSVSYRNQVFSLVWDFYRKDPAKVEQVAASDPDTQVTLALFYALRDSPQDALRIWNGLSADQKEKHRVNGRTIATSLLRQNFFTETFEFAKQTGLDPDAAAETVTNGGFEAPLGEADDTMFGWRIYRDQQRIELIGDTATKHTGQRSLKVIFRTYNKPELYNAVQLVKVEPQTRYRLKFFVRTENLKSGGTPLIDISDGRTALVITGSEPLENGTADWSERSIEFTTPAKCDGIFIKMGRVPCGENCPISGTVWFDDFSLERL